MSVLKKGMIYFVLFFIMVWMFLLGVMVGRDSAPVKFDTRAFQNKLSGIAETQNESQKASEKTEIQFYEALKDPDPEPNADSPLLNQTSVTKKIPQPSEEKSSPAADREIPVKLSKKAATIKGAPELSQKKKQEISKKTEARNPAPPAPANRIRFTIQVGAYKEIKGALEKISFLESKGYNAYRTMGKVGDEIWHRVRIGHFPNTDVARTYLRRLKKDQINGIIIKQE